MKLIKVLSVFHFEEIVCLFIYLFLYISVSYGYKPKKSESDECKQWCSLNEEKGKVNQYF